MDVKKEAMNFAIEALDDKVRKAEPEKPSVIHSIDVANKIEKYGFDDNVIAAGYLHDIVEDTEYTIVDIKNIFGSDIASLVKGATEEDRTLSWEERKLATINRIKGLDLRHKAIITCDKLGNSEDLLNLFGRNGKEDFSSFKRGKDKKIWYWQESYKSLIYNEDKDLPMFKDLKNNIDSIIQRKEITNKPSDMLKYKCKEIIKLSTIIDIDDYYKVEIISSIPSLKDSLIDILKHYLNIDNIIINDNNINIVEELVKIDINYLNNKLPSDRYLEQLHNIITYIKENINKIIYITSDSNNPQLQKSLLRIIRLLKNNNIDIDIINMNNKNMDNITIDICNNIINNTKNLYLNNIKKTLTKKNK